MQYNIIIWADFIRCILKGNMDQFFPVKDFVKGDMYEARGLAKACQWYEYAQVAFAQLFTTRAVQ